MVVTRERREYTRHTTGGELEILSVVGSDMPSRNRAQLLDCSRGGARFRFPAPEKRLFRRRSGPPPLQIHDSITCTLRLPPAYEPIQMFGEVVRVKMSLSGEAEVGLRFFCDVGRRSAMNPMQDALGRLLEPEKLKAEVEAEHSRRLELNQARRSSRRMREVEEEQPLSCSEAARIVTESSQRLRREEQPLSCSEAARIVTETSARLRKQSSRVEIPKPERRPLPPRAPLPSPPALPKPPRSHGRRTPIAGRRPARSSASAPRLGESLRGLDDSRLLESDIGNTPTLSPAHWRERKVHIAAEPRLLDFGGQLGVRGRARLRRGVAVVELPESFTSRVEAETLTVQVTARGPAALYVWECRPDRVVVRALEVPGTVSGVQFDFLVLADRIAPLRA